MPLTKFLKPGLFILCLAPFAMLMFQIYLEVIGSESNLGADPAKTLSLETGQWTLRFLLLTLSMTPLRQISGLVHFVRYRRMVGLFTLFYASLHLLVFLMFLLQWQWRQIAEEIIERPYITVGFSAFLILVVLGMTSTNGMVRRLGKNWKRLHRLVYLAAVLGVVHLTWIARSDLGEAFFYGAMLCLLLCYRMWRYFQRQFISRSPSGNTA